MPLFDFFRNFFGRGAVQEPPQQRFDDDQFFKNSFRNPIWQDDDDMDDINDFSNRLPRSGFHFRIFSDPVNMAKFFEREAENMIKDFFNFGGGSSFSPFDEGDFSNALPMPNRRAIQGGLRDEVIKPTYEMPGPDSSKVDTDLDGKITPDELVKMYKKSPSSSMDVQPYQPQYSIKSFANSVSSQIFKRPDGSIEQHRTVQDSNGNKEITVTRQIGDKVHTVITKIAKDGSEEKTENIVNMNENELAEFDQKWSRSSILPKHDEDFWHKFFGLNPKL